MPMKAFAYLRVSGKSQIEGDGFTRQRASIHERCVESGYEIVQEFVEEGISGTSELDDRPALSDLFAALEDGDVHVVLIERSDRLSRDLVVGEVLLKRLRESGVKVIQAENGVDLTDEDPDNATGTLVRQILGVIAQFEKTSIVSKLRKARERKKRETGRCEGQKPFGTLPGEAATLQFMENLREQGHTTRAIAEKLNHSFAACPTRNGRPWHFSSVAKILSRILNEKPELS
jgi:DNA invertase Pin-like site-specific DNA recombinase